MHTVDFPVAMLWEGKEGPLDMEGIAFTETIITMDTTLTETMAPRITMMLPVPTWLLQRTTLRNRTSIIS